MGANDPMALGGDPEISLVVFRYVGEAGVRLDVGLMDRRCLELALDYEVRLGETGVDVALAEFELLGDVRRRRRRRAHALGEEVVEQ